MLIWLDRPPPSDQRPKNADKWQILTFSNYLLRNDKHNNVFLMLSWAEEWPACCSNETRITLHPGDAVLHACNGRAGEREYPTRINETQRNSLQADVLTKALRKGIARNCTHF